jgi:hypothetical protein
LLFVCVLTSTCWVGRRLKVKAFFLELQTKMTTTLKEAIKPYYKEHKWASLLSEQPINVWDFWEQCWTLCTTSTSSADKTELASFIYLTLKSIPLHHCPALEELSQVFEVGQPAIKKNFNKWRARYPQYLTKNWESVSSGKGTYNIQRNYNLF